MWSRSLSPSLLLINEFSNVFYSWQSTALQRTNSGQSTAERFVNLSFSDFANCNTKLYVSTSSCLLEGHNVAREHATVYENISREFMFTPNWHVSLSQCTEDILYSSLIYNFTSPKTRESHPKKDHWKEINNSVLRQPLNAFNLNFGRLFIIMCPKIIIPVTRTLADYCLIVDEEWNAGSGFALWVLSGCILFTIHCTLRRSW